MRIAEFDQFFTDAVLRAERPDRTRLDLLIATDAVPLGRDLAARETSCCSFFGFSFEPVGGGSVMHIDVPVARIEILDALENRMRSR